MVYDRCDESDGAGGLFFFGNWNVVAARHPSREALTSLAPRTVCNLRSESAMECVRKPPASPTVSPQVLVSSRGTEFIRARAARNPVVVEIGVGYCNTVLMFNTPSICLVSQIFSIIFWLISQRARVSLLYFDAGYDRGAELFLWMKVWPHVRRLRPKTWFPMWRESKLPPHEKSNGLGNKRENHEQNVS